MLDVSRDIVYIKVLMEWLAWEETPKGGFVIDKSGYVLGNDIICCQGIILIHKYRNPKDAYYFDVDEDMDFQLQTTMSTSEYYSFCLSATYSQHYNDGYTLSTECHNLKELQSYISPVLKRYGNNGYSIPRILNEFI